MLDYRTFDSKYFMVLYLQYKLGQLFDIYVNGEIVNLVSENTSLLNFKSGLLEFVVVQRYWKQNGIEGSVETSHLPINGNIETFKRTFTNQSLKTEKLWEYSFCLFNLRFGYKIILRHYLSDRIGAGDIPHRYTLHDINISIKANDKNQFFSKNIVNIAENDYVLIETLAGFIDRNSFSLIAPHELLYNNTESTEPISYYFSQKLQQQQQQLLLQNQQQINYNNFPFDNDDNDEDAVVCDNSNFNYLDDALQNNIINPFYENM
ncbi:hypothetical protein DICPUDRAFT_74704 [Dictyostelium purpureum]|uniref:Uncharacterized protein n=1 Tax=Dictyostelium purpureum TaxID=5786 RepID=F0Z8I2_DICPU|nr:uncharacterized protein DICPUDRAFT_74704 [Dictyostelium purpureum]EGC39761.1 hypothetical protein DICPUDRAFT_74704 [Dictyostelium purpureum]|eukprot:XP_003283747.1 hypothetical protein DICPUDRAFT_74704 [Dictyostelium purpureum]